MKKVLFGLIALSAVSMAQTEGLGNLYFKFGADVAQKYKQINEPGIPFYSSKDAKDIGYELTIEGTKEVAPNFELGLGVSYQDHGKIKDCWYPTGEPVSDDYDKEYGDIVSGYKSIPLYVTGKYNIPVESNVKVYLKADLGYSFNVGEKDTEWKFLTIKNGEEERWSAFYKQKVKNGAYFGVGAGVEYNEFVAEVMYKVNKAKVTFPELDTSGKLDYSRVTLAVGYKLGF